MPQLRSVFLLALAAAVAIGEPINKKIDPKLVLPDVILKEQFQLKTPQKVVDPFSDDFPPQKMLSDINDPLERLQAAYNYCTKYFDFDKKGEVNETFMIIYGLL